MKRRQLFIISAIFLGCVMPVSSNRESGSHNSWMNSNRFTNAASNRPSSTIPRPAQQQTSNKKQASIDDLVKFLLHWAERHSPTNPVGPRPEVPTITKPPPTFATVQIQVCNYTSERSDCGYPGITPAECRQRGCCWDHRVINKLWCFHRKIQTKIVDSVQNRASNNAHFERKPLSPINPTTTAASRKSFYSDEEFLRIVAEEVLGLEASSSFPAMSQPLQNPFERASTTTLPATISPPNYSLARYSANQRWVSASSGEREAKQNQRFAASTSPSRNSIDNKKELTALITFMEDLKNPKTTFASSPTKCSLTNEDSCCRIDPSSPCCEYQNQSPPVSRSAPTFRIVGGSPAGMLRRSVAYLSKLPYKTHFCGGTLINQEWVLTAAHCVLEYCHKFRPASELLVSLGKYQKSARAFDFGQQDKIVSHVICHPNQCKSSTTLPRLNDVALLRLREPAVITGSVIPALMPTHLEQPGSTRNCFAMGWGRTKGSGYSEILKQVSVPVIPNNKCNLPEWRNCIARACMLCAGDVNIDPCDGDSGGPLFCPRPNGIYVLHGVYSWGRCGAVARKPSIYSRTSYFLEWINKVVKSFPSRYK